MVNACRLQKLLPVFVNRQSIATCCSLKIKFFPQNDFDATTYIGREHEHPWQQPLADVIKLLCGQKCQVAENNTFGGCLANRFWQLLYQVLLDWTINLAVPTVSRAQLSVMVTRYRVVESIKVEIILQTEQFLSHWGAWTWLWKGQQPKEAQHMVNDALQSCYCIQAEFFLPKYRHKRHNTCVMRHNTCVMQDSASLTIPRFTDSEW